MRHERRRRVARGADRSGPDRPTLGFLPLPAERSAEFFFGEFGPGGAGVILNHALEMELGFFGRLADRAFGFEMLGGFEPPFLARWIGEGFAALEGGDH